MSRLHGERGVAAVTVLMVTAVLALAGGVVAFTATAELETGARDRRAEDAFSASEAGLDQAASYFFRNPTWTASQQAAGQVCLNNPLVVDTASIPCEVQITSPSGGKFVHPPTGRPFIEYTAVSQAREGRTVTRTLAGQYRIDALNIPFGMFVDGNVDLNGGPQLMRISMLVNGVVTSREKINTDWNANNQFDDPDLGWIFHGNRIVSEPAPDTCMDASSGQLVGCAGVYANFQIYEKNQQKASDEIHSPCTTACNPVTSPYPRDRDIHQTKFIGGVPQPVVTLPTTDVLEAMDGLKQLAQSQNLYFNYKNGSNSNTVIQPADIGAPAREFSRNAVVYIDADAGDTFNWKVSLVPGSTSSDMLYTPSTGPRVGPDSGILVVRGGELRINSNTLWSGAVFVPENKVVLLGGNTCTCTIYAKGFEKQGGDATVELTPAWFDKFPAGLVAVRREAFLECEPYQQSGVCP